MTDELKTMEENHGGQRKYSWKGVGWRQESLGWRDGDCSQHK